MYISIYVITFKYIEIIISRLCFCFLLSALPRQAWLIYLNCFTAYHRPLHPHLNTSNLNCLYMCRLLYHLAAVYGIMSCVLVIHVLYPAPRGVCPPPESTTCAFQWVCHMPPNPWSLPEHQKDMTDTFYLSKFALHIFLFFIQHSLSIVEMFFVSPSPQGEEDCAPPLRKHNQYIKNGFATCHRPNTKHTQLSFFI